MSLLSKKFDPSLPAIPRLCDCDEHKLHVERKANLRKKEAELSERRAKATAAFHNGETASALALKVLDGKPTRGARREDFRAELDGIEVEEAACDEASKLLTRELQQVKESHTRRVRDEVRAWYGGLIHEIIRRAEAVQELADLEQQFRQLLAEAGVPFACDCPLEQHRKPVLLAALHPLGQQENAVDELRRLAAQYNL